MASLIADRVDIGSGGVVVTPPSSPQGPYTCNDSLHCGQNQPCLPNAVQVCPGIDFLGIATPPSTSGIVHPVPNRVHACAHCRTHWNFQAPHVRLGMDAGLVQNAPGYRAQLCEDCIRDEVELYWKRAGAPPPPGVAPSMAFIQQWPLNAGGIQDLCVCRDIAITPFANHCHTCREEAFRHLIDTTKTHAQDILGTRTKPVIKGEKTCTANGGTTTHLVPAPHLQRRRTARIGRQCPCGARPKPIPRPPAHEYITYCLGCMGVRITGHHLPSHLRLNPAAGTALVPRRRSERLAARNPGYQPGDAAERTKGPRRAARSHLFRVNIERGWVPNDPFVGGV